MTVCCAKKCLRKYLAVFHFLRHSVSSLKCLCSLNLVRLVSGCGLLSGGSLVLCPESLKLATVVCFLLLCCFRSLSFLPLLLVFLANFFSVFLLVLGNLVGLSHEKTSGVFLID